MDENSFPNRKNKLLNNNDGEISQQRHGYTIDIPNSNSMNYNSQSKENRLSEEFIVKVEEMTLTSHIKEDYFNSDQRQEEAKNLNHESQQEHSEHAAENVNDVIGTESDASSSNQQQPNTDEDTKANSEEDSPQFQAHISSGSEDECKTDKNQDQQEEQYSALIQQNQKKNGQVSKEDFTLIQVIGTGTYGKVLLVKKKGSEKLFAMKILKKKRIRQLKQVQHTMTERKILEKINHPFIVKLNYAFQSDKKLFFVLDYCPGGELFFYISQIGRFKESSAKFYSANIVLALECLHENGIIYRDLKPENILIDKDGYAKLTDFGLSKDNLKSDSLANSFCGTAEYIAPEIIQKKGYNKGCDWWSFGCVLYEMLSGLPPFYCKKKSDIYNAILLKNPNFYNYHSPLAINLISRLLDKDPKTRLGSKKGAQEIKDHPFFADIDWNKMLRKELTTPYKPVLQKPDDTNHFIPEITCIPIESPPHELSNSGGNASSNYAEDFEGFSYVAHTILLSPSPTHAYLQ